MPQSNWIPCLRPSFLFLCIPPCYTSCLDHSNLASAFTNNSLKKRPPQNDKLVLHVCDPHPHVPFPSLQKVVHNPKPVLEFSSTHEPAWLLWHIFCCGLSHFITCTSKHFIRQELGKWGTFTQTFYRVLFSHFGLISELAAYAGCLNGNLCDNDWEEKTLK